MAFAQISGQKIGTQRAGSSGSALVLTYPSNTTTGNLLIAVITTNGVNVTVTDNMGNTWSQAVSNQSGVPQVQIWYCANATGGSSHAVTITPSSSAYMSAVIDEFSGEVLTGTLDLTGTAGSSGTTFSSGSVTTTSAGELYITGVGCDSSNGTLASSGAGFTDVYSNPATFNQEGIGYAYQVGGAGGSYSNTWASGSGVQYSGVIASFKAASGGLNVSKSVSDTLSLSQTATGQKQVHESVSQTLSLVQSVTNNIKEVSVSQTLALVQTVAKLGPVYVTVNQTLPLIQGPESGGSLSAAASSTLHLSDRINRTVDVTVSQALSLVSNGETNPGYVKDVLNLIQSVTAGKGHTPISDVLKLVQIAKAAVVGNYSVADALNLHQAASGYALRSNYRCQYNPFVGVTTDTTYTQPSPTAPTLGSATLTLTYPFVSPTTTLVLRNPDWGNRNRLNFSRIYRETRGGTLIVFGDPTWPKQQTLEVQVEALTATQFANLKTFLSASLGQLIGLLDWENRQWKGIILNPDTALIQNGRQNRSVSFQFQGILA